MDKIENNAFFKISYGLFVLSAQGTDGKDNGCIINTVTQVTDTPKRITVAVNKANYTCKMIEDSGKLNISILSTAAEFSLFERFGFQSGKNVNKLEGFSDYTRSENGLFYLTKGTNAYLSANVTGSVDMGTHILFIADITQAHVLNDEPSVTYDYYGKNIKPKPKTEKKKGYICKICGYVYEGDTLPDDFICPICKHGVADFEKL